MENITHLLVLFAFGLLGLFASQVFDISSSGIKKLSDFKIKKWWDDNAIQLFTSLLALIILLLLGEPLAVLALGSGFQFNELSVFFIGFSSDALTNYFARRRAKIDNQ